MNSKCNFSVPLLLFLQLRSTILIIHKLHTILGNSYSREFRASSRKPKQTGSNLIPAKVFARVSLAICRTAERPCWRGGVSFALAGLLPFRLPRRKYIKRKGEWEREGEREDPGVIWIQGNCVLRKAEEPSHFKPDSKHGLLPDSEDNVASSGESVYCSSSWQDRKRERRFHVQRRREKSGRINKHDPCPCFLQPSAYRPFQSFVSQFPGSVFLAPNRFHGISFDVST